MGQSFVKNYMHIVFSTKHRVPLITPDIEPELHRYLGGICNSLNCQSVKVGGYTDHVHILCMLSKNIAMSQLMQELKSSSSKWIKTLGPDFRNFYWQTGYGAFSVRSSDIDGVVRYIENQHAHHSKKSFQDEYRAILTKNKLEWDERYVWG
jgi:putative transposase